jgi:hypothetical protein
MTFGSLPPPCGGTPRRTGVPGTDGLRPPGPSHRRCHRRRSQAKPVGRGGGSCHPQAAMGTDRRAPDPAIRGVDSGVSGGQVARGGGEAGDPIWACAKTGRASRCPCYGIL